MDPNKKKFFIIVFLVIFLPAVVAITAFVIHNVIEANNKKEVSIANMSDYLQKNDYNSDYIARIENRLYETIEYNVGEDVAIKSLNVVIREGTFNESFDINKNVRMVKFVADIEEIKQSYGVKLEWDEAQDSEADTQADEWGTEVYCLDKKDLIYGDFNCKDFYTITYGSNDPIINILPYTEYNSFTIYYSNDGNGKVDKIYVDIFGCMDKYATPDEEAANKWLTENISNLQDYKVEYSYCNGGA